MLNLTKDQITTAYPDITFEKSYLKEIFGSKANFFKKEVRKVWGDAGYTTKHVEKKSNWNTTKDIIRGIAATSDEHIKAYRGLAEGVYTLDFKKFWNQGVKGWVKSIGLGFKTSRYYYHYTQNVQMINGSFIPDPIQTYAMGGVVVGQNASESVQTAIKQGKGFNLKKLYQYQKHRYQNRMWEWETYTTTQLKPSSTLFDEVSFLKTLPTDRTYITIAVNKEFEPDNQLYKHWLQKEKGIDSFHSAEPLEQNTRPTEPSVGITLWSGPLEPFFEKSGDLGIEDVVLYKPKDLEQLKVGESAFYKIFSVFDNPYDTSNQTDKVNENKDTLDPMIDMKAIKIDVVIEVKYLGSNGIVHKYQLFEKHIATKYDKEHHFYLTKSGSSNHDKFKSFWKFTKESRSNQNRLTSITNPELYNFYAPIPIKDWLEGKDTWSQILPKLDEEKGLVKALKTVGEINREHYQEKEEETSDNSFKGKREIQKLSKKKLFKVKWEEVIYYPETKQNERGDWVTTVREWRETHYRYTDRIDKDKGEEVVKDTFTKLSGSKEELELHERRLQRFITRELTRKRKVKFNKDELWDKKDYSESALKRHIEYMTDLIGLNYIQYTAQLMSANEWNGGYGNTNTYQSSIYMGAIFSNQTAENHEYWYEWAKRQYYLEEGENSYLRWISLVEAASSLKDLPQRVIRYETTDSTHWGAFSYCFIRKITLKGNVRKIKRKYRLKDILRGKPVTVSSIEQLRRIIEPPKEIAKDKWFTNPKSGKQYPIGGEIFAGSGYTEGKNPDINQVFQNYSYTLFAKQTGKDEITAYAICGLQFCTKASERILWCTAWQDLGYEFERLRLKYVEKKNAEDINVGTEVITGSRKYRHINKIYNHGLIPIDYQVVRRLGAINLERFALRSPLQYTWYFTEQKGKRSGMKWVRPIVTVVGFIVSVVLTMFGQVWTWVLFAKALLIAAAVAVAVNFAVKHVLMPLLKALGLKGIVAIIIMIVILLIAAYFGGGFDTSALPYASETTGKIAEQVGNEIAKEVVKEVTTQTTMEAIQSTISEIAKETFKQLVGTNLPQVIQNGVAYGVQATQLANQDEMQQIQSGLEAEKKAFNEALQALQDQQEELQSQMAQFDVKAVLERLKGAIVPNHMMSLENALDNVGVLGSDEYLSTFLEMKLNLDPETFDLAKSTDFTFKT